MKEPNDEAKDKVMKIEEIVSDEEMNKSFENTNFGDRQPRVMIKDGINKVVQGYATGYTIECILIELGLTKKPRPRKIVITDKGYKYLKAVGMIKY